MHRPLAAGLILATLALPLSGCGAVVARARIVSAETAVAAAARADAEKKATYEYTSAVLYLEKAREEESSGRFGPAIRYAGSSTELAEKAKLDASAADPLPEP